jgi:hypothetical protein
VQTLKTFFRLFGGHGFQSSGIAAFRSTLATFGGSITFCATWATRAGGSCAATWCSAFLLASFCLLRHFLSGNGGFYRRIFNNRLRSASGNFHLRHGLRLNLRLGLLLRPWLMLRTRLMLLTRLVLRARLANLRLSGLMRRALHDHVLIIAIHIIVAVIVSVEMFTIIVIAIIALNALLHLRLGRCNDPIVMFCVLKIVFGHNAIAGALGITGKGHVFFSNMLRRAANFYIRARAVIAACQRISAFTIKIIVVAVAATAATAIATPPTALVLLSWPHRLLT